jgi:TolB-like protein/Tfp pilus assembly protein PilF
MYAVGAWLVVQVADATFEPLGVPETAHRILILVAALGFPIALVLGWLFDWTSEGLVRTPDDPEQAVARLRSHRRIDFAIIGALVLALGMALFGPEMGTAPGEVPPIRAVAVLAFADMSPAGDQGYLGDGIAEEIMGGLSKVDALRVTARTSAFAFKGRNESIQTIGEQLGVGAVVEGSVRKAGNRLRITAQLIRVADGFELWSHSFDRKLDDVFAIQDEIARATVAALKVELIGTRQLVKPPTGDVRAYELYVTGRHFLGRRTKSDLQQATSYFERALEVDPQFQLAYVGLAESRMLAFNYAYDEDAASLAKAEAAARRALAIDPNSGEARSSLAYIHMMYWRMQEAEAEFREALRLDPDYSTAHLFFALFLRTSGRVEEAQAEFTAALELDPLSPIIHREVGRNLFYRGEYAQAIEWLDSTLKLYWDIPFGITYMLRAQFALGREPDRFGWFPGQGEAELRTAYEEGGSGALMSRALDIRIAETDRACTDRPDIAAMTLALLSDREAMYTCLEQAVEKGAGPVAVVVAPDPAFEEYRFEPRFIALMERIGVANVEE